MTSSSSKVRIIKKSFDHTINALIDSGRQVVVASAMTPAKLKCLDPRMRSRMAGGLVTEIGSFDRELRQRILQQRVQLEADECPGFIVPDEVMNFLTDKLTKSGRELEGAITRLRAAYQLTAQPVTMQVSMDIVAAIVGGAGATQSTHRRYFADHFPAIRCFARRSIVSKAYPINCQAPPDWHVFVQAIDLSVPPRNRAPVRWQRPYNGHSCHSQD